jgi:hypothetical protein
MEKEDEDIKYCVVAFIDLLGFSSHLEVSNDLRTDIGRAAIKRLESLDDVLTLITQESKKYPAFYPAEFFSYTRINDALILSLDLNDALRPSVGETFPLGKTTAEWEEYFDFSNIPEERFEEEYAAKLKRYTRPVELFVGIVARIHHHINSLESQQHFPGAKSVISSGFRRRFISNNKEDVLSANFAFSNAYLAEKQLSAPRLYVDNNILQLLTADHLTRNVAKLSCFTYRYNVFSPFNEKDEVFGLGGQYVETEIQSLTLLRKQYYFRHVNQNPLTYLQLLDEINSAINYIQTIERPVLRKRVVKELSDSGIEKKVESGEFVITLKWPFSLRDDIDEFLQNFTDKSS